MGGVAVWWDLGPCGEGEYPIPHLLPKLLATRKMLMVPGCSLVPSSIPSCPGSAFPAIAPGEPLCPWGIVAFCVLQHLVGKQENPLSSVTRDSPGLQGSCVTSGTLGILTPCSGLHLIPIFAAPLFSQANY